MRAGLIGLVVVVVLAVVAAMNSLFIVNPADQVLVLQLGEVKQRIRTPGLNFKIPLIQNVLYFDKRNLDLNVPSQEIIAADQKRLVVDAFLRYRIRDPELFYQTVNNVDTARTRLTTFLTGSLRAVLADATFLDIVRDDRADLMQRIKAAVTANAQSIGIDVVDVRIRRADLPGANSAAIYERMKTERRQEATEIRAQGAEAAQRITAAADRTATVLRAEANREAEQIRGQGDGQKNAIFAEAYSKDPQFFAFYRAMQAYDVGLGTQDTRLVLSPNTDFFRFFNDPTGGISPFPTPPAAAGQPGVTPAPGPQAGAPAASAPATPASPTVAATGDPATTPATVEPVTEAVAAAARAAAASAASSPDTGGATPPPAPAAMIAPAPAAATPGAPAAAPARAGSAPAANSSAATSSPAEAAGPAASPVPNAGAAAPVRSTGAAAPASQPALGPASAAPSVGTQGARSASPEPAETSAVPTGTAAALDQDADAPTAIEAGRVPFVVTSAAEPRDPASTLNDRAAPAAVVQAVRRPERP